LLDAAISEDPAWTITPTRNHGLEPADGFAQARIFPSMELDKRIVIVTGASKGIGLELSRALVARGAVVFGFARGEKDLAAVHDELGDSFRPIVCDVGSEEQVGAAIRRIIDQEGRVDVLINNAGIGMFGPIEELDSDEWHRMFATNVHGVFYCTRAVVPTMKKQNQDAGFGGHIVNVSSVAGLVANPGISAYNHTKFGLRGFTEGLMKELRHDGIRVTAVYPGSVATPFFSDREQDYWKLKPENIAATIIHILEMPDDNLISEVVIRPLRPPR
jgi:NAD(P)-dependent dehydrogenase (short-subunit alcohol dehydrogenase family)